MNTPKKKLILLMFWLCASIGHVFAVFLDDLNEKNWHERFSDDDSLLYPVDTYDMAFDDNKEAESE